MRIHKKRKPPIPTLQSLKTQKQHEDKKQQKNDHTSAVNFFSK
jgi:hypothetical protein